MIFEEKLLPVETYNLGLDSNFRDMAKYPNAAEYVIPFDNIFKNVVSFQLVFAVYEKNGTESYVNLYIEEMSPNLVANTSAISGSFCQLPLINTQNVYETSMYKCIKTFEKPLAKLSRLTIRFLKANGDVYPMKDHFMKFEVQCMKFSGNTKEWKNNEFLAQGVTMYEPTVRPSAHAHANTNEVILKVPDNYDIDMLKMALNSAIDVLKSQALPSEVYNQKYKQLKEEFKRLCMPL